jgi:CARDB protein
MRWTLLLIVAGLALPASASAAPLPAHVKLTACGSGDATFEGDMRAARRSARLRMRFTLLTRDDRYEPWARIPGTKLDTWVTSDPGKLRYVYDKRVEGLVAPGEYRMRVRFRWLDASGRTLASTRRVSRICRQRDPRPDLQFAGLRFDGSRYLLTVRNAGRSTAAAADFSLTVPGSQPVIARSAALLAGAKTTLSFTAPACNPGSVLQVVLDAADEVDEAAESDDAVAVPCPAGR